MVSERRSKTEESKLESAVKSVGKYCARHMDFIAGVLAISSLVGLMYYQSQIKHDYGAIFKKYDTNSDGMLSSSEYKELCNDYKLFDKKVK